MEVAESNCRYFHKEGALTGHARPYIGLSAPPQASDGRPSEISAFGPWGCADKNTIPPMRGFALPPRLSSRPPPASTAPLPLPLLRLLLPPSTIAAAAAASRPPPLHLLSLPSTAAAAGGGSNASHQHLANLLVLLLSLPLSPLPSNVPFPFSLAWEPGACTEWPYAST